MSNKQDDELYDEILGDSFEDDGSFDSEYADDLEAFDEFDDLDAMPDDSIAEPWDDTQSASAFDDKLIKKEKKSLNLSFNTIVITGAVVVGGFFLVYNVMSAKPSATTGQRFASALQFTGATDDIIYGEEQKKSEDPSTTPKQEDNAEQAVNEEKGFLFEPDSLDSMEMNLENAAAAPVIQGSIQDLSTPENIEIVDILKPAPQAENIKEAPAPLTNVPRAPAIQAVEKPVEDEIEILPEAVLEAEPEEYVAVKHEQEQPPVVVPQKIEPKEAETTKLSESPKLSSLENKLDLIVTRLDSMEGQIQEIKSSNNKNIDEVSATLAELDQKVNKLQSAPMKATPANKVAVNAPKKTVQKASPSPAVAKVSWELRAAQPGKAWVSRTGQKEMQAVMVGDNLEGIGRVNAISFNNGRWLVQGSSGQIRQ